MSADLHIHILEGITESDLAAMKSCVFGSKHFSPTPQAFRLDISTKVGETPNIWIGEVSWLKAMLFEDAESYVPDPVGKVAELVGEDLPVLSDELIGAICEALTLPNKTQYKIADPAKVREFLEFHKGKQIFEVSW